jgi:predicted nucleic acid-binding protein
MAIHLDTNQLIGAGRRGSSAHLRVDQWLRAGESLETSALAWAEFLCGPVLPLEKKAAHSILGTIHPLDASTAALGATLFNNSGRRSRSLPDCLIAATALIQKASLATENRQDFLPFSDYGLIIL